jgi:hypothetical protein
MDRLKETVSSPASLDGDAASENPIAMNMQA